MTLKENLQVVIEELNIKGICAMCGKANDILADNGVPLFSDDVNNSCNTVFVLPANITDVQMMETMRAVDEILKAETRK